MAKFMKRSIAMLLVFNMMLGMLPAQALAAKGSSSKVKVSVSSKSKSKSSSSKSKSKSSSSSSSRSSSSKSSSSKSSSSTKSMSKKLEAKLTASAGEPAPSSAEEPKLDSQLTTGAGINVEKQPVEENTKLDANGNTITTESQTTTTNGTLKGGETISGVETYTEITVTGPNGEEIRGEANIKGEETIEGDYEVDHKTDVPDVEVPIIEGEKAEEEVELGTTVETDENGVTTETTTTVDQVENEDGTTTEVTTETEVVKDAEGEIVDFTETTTSVTKTENKDGSTTTNVKVEETTTETTGDLPTDENDNVFNFIESEITIVRDVTVDASGMVTTDQGEVDLDQIIAPEKYEGKQFMTGALSKDNPQANGLFNGMDPNSDNPDMNSYPKDEEGNPIPGYDYVISGNGDASCGAAPVVAQVVYKKNEDGTPQKDPVTGEFVIESITPIYAGDKALYSGMNSVPGQIVVKNEEGEYFYTYCIDKITPTQSEIWYKVSNLEDSDYYDNDESAAMLRAIVTNGYWGTDANVYETVYEYEYETDENGDVKVDENGEKIVKVDEDGNKVFKLDENGEKVVVYEVDENGEFKLDENGEKIAAKTTVKDENGNIVTDSTVTGSLAKMKELLRQTYGEDEEITVKDKSGQEFTYNIHSLIDGLMEHEAMAVTQSAIWSYSNGCLATQNGQDGLAVMGVYSAKKHFNSKGNPVNQYSRVYDTESDARLQILYDCLLGLNPVYADDEDVTTVINEKNAFEDMGVTIKEQVTDHANNQDDDKDNDVYETEVNFTLAFVPDPNSDALLVQLTYGEGEDQKTIVKRLAGEKAEGEDFDTIIADENGTYTITGLQLEENSDFTFDLNLTGTHNLKNGVYVYSAYGGRGASQTLVGLAGGTQNVNVKSSMTISFNVVDSKRVVATRTWSTAGDPEKTPRDNTPPPTANYRLTRGVGQLEIIDEEVPLAEPPQTGDISMLYFAMVLVSGLGLCMLNLLEKKREEA